MKDEFPRIPMNDDHGPLHPGNMLGALINGLASVEAWRQRPTVVSKALERWQGDLTLQNAMLDKDIAKKQDTSRFRLSAALRPEVYQRPFQERMIKQHTDAADLLGISAVAITVERPRFGAIKKWFMERERTHHMYKADQAAGKLHVLDKSKNDRKA